MLLVFKRSITFSRSGWDIFDEMNPASKPASTNREQIGSHMKFFDTRDTKENLLEIRIAEDQCLGEGDALEDFHGCFQCRRIEYYAHVLFDANQLNIV